MVRGASLEAVSAAAAASLSSAERLGASDAADGAASGRRTATRTSQLLSSVATSGAGGRRGARVGMGVVAMSRSLHWLTPSGLAARSCPMPISAFSSAATISSLITWPVSGFACRVGKPVSGNSGGARAGSFVPRSPP